MHCKWNSLSLLIYAPGLWLKDKCPHRIVRPELLLPWNNLHIREYQKTPINAGKLILTLTTAENLPLSSLSVRSPFPAATKRG